MLVNVGDRIQSMHEKKKPRSNRHQALSMACKKDNDLANLHSKEDIFLFFNIGYIGDLVGSNSLVQIIWGFEGVELYGRPYLLKS